MPCNAEWNDLGSIAPRRLPRRRDTPCDDDAEWWPDKAAESEISVAVHGWAFPHEIDHTQTGGKTTMAGCFPMTRPA